MTKFPTLPSSIGKTLAQENAKLTILQMKNIPHSNYCYVSSVSRRNLGV